ncbi:hypothetical protein Tco_1058370 [Tanacetum coccineum]|uniref:Uncharacterized protein n=1 Tax=Tanacetum coccineum TaxID=301880 RepID=A0ABQ5H8I4_9ASTR
MFTFCRKLLLHLDALTLSNPSQCGLFWNLWHLRTRSMLCKLHGCILETHECTFQSSYFQWTPIQDTSELVRGNDYCKLRYHLLSESESKLCSHPVAFQLLGVFSGHLAFTVAPGDPEFISHSACQKLNISRSQSDYNLTVLLKMCGCIHKCFIRNIHCHLGTTGSSSIRGSRIPSIV